MAEQPTNKLNDFISQIKKTGLARLSRFQVIITPPAALSKIRYGKQDSLSRLLMLCDRVDLPGTTIATNEVQVYGEQRSMPYQRIYDKLQMSFYVDTDMDVKKFFDKWVQLIINPRTHNHYYYKEYIAQIEIWVHDIENNNRYKVILKECYPTSIGSISMDYGAKDVMKLDIGMMYKYYRVEEFIEPDIDWTQPIDVTDMIPKNMISATGFTANTVDTVISGRTAMQDTFGYGYSDYVNPSLNKLLQ
jgi:hypothetical protein